MAFNSSLKNTLLAHTQHFGFSAGTNPFFCAAVDNEDDVDALATDLLNTLVAAATETVAVDEAFVDEVSTELSNVLSVLEYPYPFNLNNLS